LHHSRRGQPAKARAWCFSRHCTHTQPFQSALQLFLNRYFFSNHPVDSSVRMASLLDGGSCSNISFTFDSWPVPLLRLCLDPDLRERAPSENLDRAVDRAVDCALLLIPSWASTSPLTSVSSVAPGCFCCLAVRRSVSLVLRALDCDPLPDARAGGHAGLRPTCKRPNFLCCYKMPPICVMLSFPDCVGHRGTLSELQ